MKMKSYFAPTVEAAMAQARSELGPDALLVNSRKAPPEALGLGEYEVVFATLPERPEEKSAPSTDAATAAPDNPETPQQDPVMRELARLRRQIEEMGCALNGLNKRASSALAPEFAEAFARLVENDFSIEIAKRIVKQAQARLEADPASWQRRKMPFDRESIARAVQTELEALVLVDASLGAGDDGTSVVALVGPPGCGKTTTLVKLGVRYGVAASRPVHLISTDTQRIAAAEQLRTYATIIGASFDAVETTRSLQQAIAAHPGRGLILIDTQGYASGEMETAAELAHFLSCQPNTEVQLVTSASMRGADLSRTVDRYQIFAPAKLIFTRLDESSCLGAVVSESARTGKPVSFLAAGQQIPEDLEPATAARLIEPVLDLSGERILSAA
jgi:flagellar biosynthesis protein FlhF